MCLRKSIVGFVNDLKTLRLNRPLYRTQMAGCIHDTGNKVEFCRVCGATVLIDK